MEKTEFLPNVQTEEKKENSAPVQSGAVNADMNAAAQQTQMDKFQAAQGHGYAAEQANNLYDILTGKDAKIVGGDNAKDGPDRMVNGVNIQTKYCHDAASLCRQHLRTASIAMLMRTVPRCSWKCPLTSTKKPWN